MLLSKQTTIRVTKEQSNIVNHLGYAAYKLWNVCNYERKTYDPATGADYPDWYKQKASHKDDMWYKALPSQTAQEVCKVLDKSWKSYFRLVKTKGIVNPHPPRYKNDPISVTYMQNGIKRIDNITLRLTLTKAFKKHMSERYGIHEDYLIIKNKIFDDMDNIKQIKIYMPEDNEMKIIVVYEIAEKELKEDNGRYLSIDLGLHNLMTCYDSAGKSFIIGRQYLSICRRYDKEIRRIEGRCAAQQVKKGIKYPKPSKHILELFDKKRNSVKDILHKYTREIVSYCENNHINTIIIGDLTGIREDNDLGDRINQQLHSLPYRKIYEMLEYKSRLAGIRFEMVKESYSSQCSPMSEYVGKDTAKPQNRTKRGLYDHDGVIWNADCVGAFNIMRLYMRQNGIQEIIDLNGLNTTETIKVAV